MDDKWMEKAGEAVMVLSALASVVNHIVRQRQAEQKEVAGWLLQLNALLNVGALNLDKAHQQFKAAKAAGSGFSLVGVLLSLFKGKAPAVEAILEKAAEVEAKAEETHVVGITAGEPLMAVAEPITLVKEEAAEEKVELTVREPELEQKVTQEDVSASAAAGVVDFVHNGDEAEEVMYTTAPKKVRAKAPAKKAPAKKAKK
jgi:hypothetical protein